MMNEATGRKIGDKVGKTLEVDAEDDGSAIGRYLRIKVRLDVRKPLLRGVMMEDEDGEAFGALSNTSSSQISVMFVVCWGILIRL